MRIFSLLDTQYTNFTNRVTNYLSKLLSKNKTTLGSNNVFGQIITVVGNAIQNVMLYIEDALVEQNKYTAQRKKSIYNLAALSGYMPSLGKAALVNLKLSYMPNNISPYNVIINNKEPLTCTQNGLRYNLLMTQEATVLNADKENSPKYFTAVQGIFQHQKFISSGGQYYTINLKYVGNIDTDYITVKVNNELWEYCNSIYDMSSDGKQYTFTMGINGGINLIFGNEAHGRALKVDDVIDVDYLIHDGEQGNLNPNLETYFTFDNQLYDTKGEYHEGNAIFTIRFGEKDPVTSGSNSETIEHTAHMIGLNSRSLVLASPENYKILINRLGFCGYNRTWAEPNSPMINSLIIKNFNKNLKSGEEYFNLSENDFKLSEEQKNSIYNYVKNTGNHLSTVIYKIIDPDLCKYAMYIYIKLKSEKYNREIISKQIKNLIGEYFSNIESDMFIAKSDIIQLLKNKIDGLDSVNIYMLCEKNEDALINGKYKEEYFEINRLTGEYVKKIQTVKLYSGENPNLGFDNHGNICLKSDYQFPVLMGGWQYKNLNGDLVDIIEPLKIIFED